MIKISRSSMLEVSVKPVPSRLWAWEVTSGGELLASGFESTRIAASFEGNSLMFQMLAGGWKP